MENFKTPYTQVMLIRLGVVVPPLTVPPSVYI